MNETEPNKTASAQSHSTDGLGVPGEIVLVHDDVSNRLDEMADLCEYWKRWREHRNHTPHAIRSALVMLANEVVMLADFEVKNGQRIERP